jgi:hypothetical protein
MSATATIRVPRETRDLLAAYAQERGLSLSALLSEFVRRAQRVDAFRSEREATQADLSGGEAATEEREWEMVLGDGLG